MNLFDLMAKLSLNTDDYDKGLDKSQKSAKTFGQKLKSGLGTAAKVGGAALATAGAAALATGKKFYGLAKETAATGDAIDKQSQKLGVSAEGYQKWDYVLQLAGTSMDKMRGGLKTLTNKLDDAKNGSSSAIESFERIGLSLEDIKDLSTEDLFGKVVEQFQGMEEGAERTALANDLLGRSGMELGPLFNSTAEATAKQVEQAEKYGMIMSNDAVKASAKFQDSLTTLSGTIGGLKNRFMSEFLPSLTNVTDGLAKLFSGDTSGADDIAKGVDGIVDKITEKIPTILEVGGTILEKLILSINENLPKLATSALNLVKSLAKFILDNLPTIIQTAFEIIASLIKGIGEALPDLIPKVVEIVLTIVENLLDNIDMLVDAAIVLIEGLAEGIIKALPLIIEKAPIIIVKFVSAIIRNLPKIFESGGRIIGMLAKGISDAGYKVGEKAGEIFQKIKSAIAEKVSQAVTWGRDLISNFVKGITGSIQKVIDAAKNVAGKVKSFLGFSEPEEGPLSNFHTYAPDMIDLFVKGIQDNEKKLQDQIADTFNFGNLGEITAKTAVKGTATGTSSSVVAPQPALIVVQLQSGVELARHLVKDINTLRRVDGRQPI